MNAFQNALRHAALLILLCMATGASATSYTWTGAVSSAWNEPNNWTPSGIPGPGDNVYVPSTVRVCFLDVDRTINDLSVDSGRVDLTGHVLTYVGNGTFFGGGVDHGTLALNSPNGLTTFAHTKFDASITGTTQAVQFNGARFNMPITLTKTGPGIDQSQGGNIFSSTVSLVIAGGGEMRLSSMAQDVFATDLTLDCTGTGAIRFGYGLGSALLMDGAAVSIGPAGFGNGTLSFARFTQVGGTQQVLLMGENAALGFHVGTVFNGPVVSTSGRLSFAVATFHGDCKFTKTGATEDVSSGYTTFNGTTELILDGNGRLRMADTDGDMYNGDLILTNTGTGEIQFGQNGGASVLASGRSLYIGTGSFTNGALRLAHFTQQGPSAQDLTLGANAVLAIEDACTFNGALTCAAGQLEVEGSTFNGTSSFALTSNELSDLVGGNTFNGQVTFENGPGTLWTGSAAMDTFNGKAIFRTSQPNGLVVGQGSNARFRGDVATEGPVAFGSAVTASVRTIFDGTAAQRFTTNGVVPTICNLTMATSTHGGVDLFGTVEVTRDIAFTNGIIRPRAASATSEGLLVIADNATISVMGSDASHAEGYVRKVGDDAFIFPVGHNGTYAPIGISAPAGNTEAFTGNYMQQDPGPGSTEAHDPTLSSISDCEHWTLDRSNGTSAVTVTLSYDADRSCGVSQPSRLAVAAWDGSRWTDQGGGASGTPNVGMVMSAGPVADANAFTLAVSNQFAEHHGDPIRGGSEQGTSTGVDEEEVEATDATVYPNPTTGDAMVVLRGLRQGPLSLSVIDMGGQQVREVSRTVHSSTLVAPLSLDGLPAGMYLVRAIQADGRPTEVRVIKQ